MPFFIYILYSPSSQLHYVGYTDNIDRRLKQHNNSNLNTFTSKHRPWEIKTLFEVNGDKSDAIKIERFIKKQKSQKFIQTMIDTTTFTGRLAQLVKVPKLRD